MINILIKMADNLDRKGFAIEADKLDAFMRKLAEDLADELIDDGSCEKCSEANKDGMKGNRIKELEDLTKSSSSIAVARKIRVRSKAKILRNKRLK